MPAWNCLLEYDSNKVVTAGSREALTDAIRRGADLSIYTQFRHNEHIDLSSNNSELVKEIAHRGVTYLLDNRWSAGIITLRQPIELPTGFGPRPSMSFFMYNENGQQAFGRPHLDGPPVGTPNPNPPKFYPGMPKLHLISGSDAETNAPSANFIYDFDVLRYCVRDDWKEALSHTENGVVVSGSLDSLLEAFSTGTDMKVAIRGLCRDLAGRPTKAMDHEAFIQVGSYYYYTESKLFIGATHPLVRVRPAIPLTYESKGWDFGWAMVRTDGYVTLLLVDPYTLRFRRAEARCAIRWFVRDDFRPL